MAKGTYDQALKYVLESEGNYSNDPGDPGGPTNWGITIHDARTYWKPDATAADVRRMPLSVAKTIYRAHYADPLHYDELPAGLDYCVLDYGVNSGISRAAKVLQRTLGVLVDGKIGLVTLTAANSRDTESLINAICDERMRFLRGLSTWRLFGKGWTTRVRDVRRHSLAMVGKSEPTPLPFMAPPRITPVPEATPEEVAKSAKAIPPEQEIKPLEKSKTIWGGILGFLGTIGASIGGLFSNLNNQYALIAFLSIFGLIGAGALALVLRGRIDVQKVLEDMKDEQ
jgi:lysozyme family protein